MGSLLCVYEVPCEQETVSNHAFLEYCTSEKTVKMQEIKAVIVLIRHVV